jgi:hypothetical protein
VEAAAFRRLFAETGVTHGRWPNLTARAEDGEAAWGVRIGGHDTVNRGEIERSASSQDVSLARIGEGGTRGPVRRAAYSRSSSGGAGRGKRLAHVR